MMSEIEASYLAGLLDGEGCFGLTGKTWAKPSIEICMTTPAPLYWARNITSSGNLYYKSQSRPNRKPAWTWSVTKGSDIVQIIQDVRPYLQVKYAQTIPLMIYLMLSDGFHRRQYPVVDKHVLNIAKGLKAI